MKRLTAIVVGLILAFLGAPALSAVTAPAFGTASQPITSNYDGQPSPAALTRDSTERGPPASHERHLARNAADIRSVGGPVRPRLAGFATTYNYSNATALVRSTDRRATTQDGVSLADSGLSPLMRNGVAAEAEGAGARGLSETFHYTETQNAASIEANGLRPGSYATPNGGLSPLQAQIDLALQPNRGLPGSLIRIDLDGLKSAGYDSPGVGHVGRSFNMPCGGFEMQFPFSIPSEFLKVIR